MLTIDKKYINDRLSGVVEVTELSLPDCEVEGVVQGESVLIGEDRVLGEGTVEKLDVTTTRGEGAVMVEGIELVLGLLVDEVDMALGECSTLAVLTSESDVIAFVVEGE
jgi:hypothetical protein